MTSNLRTPLKRIEQLGWFCESCERECIPIRSESRCICGHRYKDHPENKCRNKSCNCESFFYIVAEGAWILRCRCKHKHIDHDPNTHQCKKPNCACEGFLSPWVCNCSHPWSDHRQKLITKEVVDVSALVGTNEASNAKEPDPGVVEMDLGWEVNRWDLVKRGD